MRILNFFASNSGAPCRTHSDFVFSDLNFPLFKACRALCWRCSWRSHPSEKNFLRLFRGGLSVALLMRNVRNRGFKHCENTEKSLVLVCFSRSHRKCGSDRWWASCHHPQKWSCRTSWAHILCLHLIWPSSQTLRCKCGVAHVLRFQDGKVRQEHVDVGVSEVVVGSGLEVTGKEQQG